MTYAYDALNRLTETVRPNGIQTTYAYDAEDQITEVRTTCFCGHLISSYTYEYNESGYVSKETAKECLFTSDQGYGHKGGEINWCAHTDANPWQNQNQAWETTTRTFTYDENGRSGIPAHLIAKRLFNRVQRG